MTKELMTYAGETNIQLARAKPDLVIKDVQMLAERVIGRNVSLSYELDPAAPDVDIDALTDLIWTNLNADNKVSLFVRYIDLASGDSETRIVNKNN